MCVYECTYAQMRVDGGVASGAGQVLVLSVRYVLVCPSVSVLLGQAEVDDVNEVAFLPQAHEEVIGLYVSVDEVLRVDVLDTADLKHARTVLLITPQCELHIKSYFMLILYSLCYPEAKIQEHTRSKVM